MQTLVVYSQDKYEIKSCKIDFEFMIDPHEKGTITLIFNDSGKISKELLESYYDTSLSTQIPQQALAKHKAINSLSIKTPDSVTYINLDSLTGFKFAQHGNNNFFQTDKGMKKIGNDTFLNKECTVMSLDNLKFWIWKGIVLKKQLNNKILDQATFIDENYIIKEDEFQIPLNVKMRPAKFEIKEIQVKDVVEMPGFPLKVSSKFKTIQDWLISICDGNPPKKPVTEFKIIFSYSVDNKNCILGLYGINTNSNGNNNSVTTVNFQPANMYFKLPQDDYENLSLEQTKDMISSKLKEFTRTQKFRNSFLSKSNIVLLFNGETIWTKQ